jgi:hypothetical protein
MIAHFFIFLKTVDVQTEEVVYIEPASIVFMQPVPEGTELHLICSLKERDRLVVTHTPDQLFTSCIVSYELRGPSEEDDDKMD